MPTEKRIRASFPVRELQWARIWTARKPHLCGWQNREGCSDIRVGEEYLRISETRLPVCLWCARVSETNDAVFITKERTP
jgi:hypothetical protein